VKFEKNFITHIVLEDKVIILYGAVASGGPGQAIVPTD
jgi:hypothetical protein